MYGNKKEMNFTLFSTLPLPSVIDHFAYKFSTQSIFHVNFSCKTLNIKERKSYYKTLNVMFICEISFIPNGKTIFPQAFLYFQKTKLKYTLSVNI